MLLLSSVSIGSICIRTLVPSGNDKGLGHSTHNLKVGACVSSQTADLRLRLPSAPLRAAKPARLICFPQCRGLALVPPILQLPFLPGTPRDKSVDFGRDCLRSRSSPHCCAGLIWTLSTDFEGLLRCGITPLSFAGQFVIPLAHFVYPSIICPPESHKLKQGVLAGRVIKQCRHCLPRPVLLLNPFFTPIS